MKKAFPFILVLIIIFGAAGYYLYSKSQKEESSEQTEESSDEVESEEDQIVDPGETPVISKKSNNVLLVIAPSKYHDNEFSQTKNAIEGAGYETTVASKGVTTASGMLGGSVSVDLDLSQVDGNDYRALVFIGGTGNNIYFDDDNALELAREFHAEEKVVAAICSAPAILAYAGILEGKKGTCDAGYKDYLTSKGATYTAEPVTVDGLIITGKGPSAAEEFGEKIVQRL